MSSAYKKDYAKFYGVPSRDVNSKAVQYLNTKVGEEVAKDRENDNYLKK